MMKPLLLLLIACLLAACGMVSGAKAPTPAAVTATEPTLPTETPAPTFTPHATETAVPTATEVPLPTATLPPPTATVEPTATATPSATPDPFTGYSIESLRRDTYGDEGEIEIIALLEETAGFTRYRIRYPSDGISIDGFMNIPHGEGTFPVVIVNHGYMPRERYELLTYTTKYADDLANAGYLTIHPSFRNHRGSEAGANPHRIGYARDVMHLIPMARRLPQADGKPVGLWGHSMGGGITLRVLTLSNQVAAAVVYGSMSGDEVKNTEAIMAWRRQDQNDEPTTGLPFLPSDEAVYAVMSPQNYYHYISAPVAIHHGVLDDQVPFAWSEELAAILEAKGVPHEFFAYESQNHNFTGEGLATLNRRVTAFFDRYMK